MSKTDKFQSCDHCPPPQNPKTLISHMQKIIYLWVFLGRWVRYYFRNPHHLTRCLHRPPPTPLPLTTSSSTSAFSNTPCAFRACSCRRPGSRGAEAMGAGPASYHPPNSPSIAQNLGPIDGCPPCRPCLPRIARCTYWYYYLMGLKTTNPYSFHGTGRSGWCCRCLLCLVLIIGRAE